MLLSKQRSNRLSQLVMLFGTFDMVHKGHMHLFTQARKLAGENGQVVVSIARDINVERIKGRRPKNTEKQRQQLVKKTGMVDKVILGGLKNYFLHIQRMRPDVIALGYDQKAYVQELKQDLQLAKMNTRVVRLRPYRKDVFKTSLLMNQ